MSLPGLDEISIAGLSSSAQDGYHRIWNDDWRLFLVCCASLFRDWLRNDRVHIEKQIITSKFQSISVKIYGIHTAMSTWCAGSGRQHCISDTSTINPTVFVSAWPRRTWHFMPCELTAWCTSVFDRYFQLPQTEFKRKHWWSQCIISLYCKWEMEK